MLATIMSTVDSYAFICSVTLGRDLIGRWRTPKGEKLADEATLPAIRWSLLATAALAIALALLSGSVIQLWKTLGSVGTPILLLPMALAQLNRARSGRRVVWSMGVSGGTALIWLVLGGGGSWHGVEAIFPGLAVSAMILFWPHGRQKKSALPQ